MIFFKFPFKKEYYTIEKKISDERKIVFTSFDETEKINFLGEIKTIHKNKIPTISAENLPSFSDEIYDEAKEIYLEKIPKVKKFIQENHLKKIVISRQKIVHYQKKFRKGVPNLSQTFFNLSENYPNAFCYFFIQGDECWLGAFSEVLAKFNKKTSRFETMALAGTLPINEAWTSKEIEEQKPVTEYITNILNTYSTDVSISETYDHISGNIKHLRTDFYCKVQENRVEDLVSALHPTPAVCGIPKDICKKGIKDFELHSRQFYSGHIRIETEDEVLYFVNLRCAKFSKEYCTIFVGGGITAQSTPEKEWCETELKSEAILSNLAIF